MQCKIIGVRSLRESVEMEGLQGTLSFRGCEELNEFRGELGIRQ